MGTSSISLARRLRFHQLELIAEVAESGSLGDAAARLHVSRAAISKSLKELEGALGIVLFERSAQGMTPTASGLRVARHARLMLNELHHLTQVARGEAQPVASRLRIGMPPFVAAHVAPGVLTRLRAMPGGGQVQVQLQEGRLNSLIERLLLGELDAIMTLFAPRAVDAMDLSMLVLRQCQVVKMVVVASPPMRVAKRKRYRWAELLDAPWILPPQGTHLRKSVDDMFAAHGVPRMQPAIESLSLEANVHLAVAGLGLAVVPEQSAEAAIGSGELRVVVMEPELPETTVVLMYRKVSAIYMDSVRMLDAASAQQA